MELELPRPFPHLRPPSRFQPLGRLSVYASIHPLYLDAPPPSPVVNPVPPAAKRVTSKKPGTLKKKFKKAKSSKQVSKVKKLKGLIRKLTKQLRAL